MYIRCIVYIMLYIYILCRQADRCCAVLCRAVPCRAVLCGVWCAVRKEEGGREGREGPSGGVCRKLRHRSSPHLIFSLDLSSVLTYSCLTYLFLDLLSIDLSSVLTYLCLTYLFWTCLFLTFLFLTFSWLIFFPDLVFFLTYLTYFLLTYLLSWLLRDWLIFLTYLFSWRIFCLELCVPDLALQFKIKSLEIKKKWI